MSTLVAYNTSTMNYDDVDGILGLSFPSLAINPKPGFLETLLTNKIIIRKSVGLMLNFDKPNSSFITFGGANMTFLAQRQRLNFINVIANSSEFRLQLGSVKINDISLAITEGLFDTGNTCITLPELVVIELLNEFNRGGNECALAL